ncbi:MAG: endo alpha-1,4 polygalactosaminidase [Streptosporangiaceae bacterium]
MVACWASWVAAGRLGAAASRVRAARVRAAARWRVSASLGRSRVDLRQLDALKPMLAERIGMCASKGFDTVELDDIDGFDPPSTTGFHLTPGDAENFLAWAFNLIHTDGMTGLWKNSPHLSWWGRQYADGAVVEECYLNHACFAGQFRGSQQYGITCSAPGRGPSRRSAGRCGPRQTGSPRSSSTSTWTGRCSTPAPDRQQGEPPGLSCTL